MAADEREHGGGGEAEKTGPRNGRAASEEGSDRILLYSALAITLTCAAIWWWDATRHPEPGAGPEPGGAAAEPCAGRGSRCAAEDLPPIPWKDHAPRRPEETVDAYEFAGRRPEAIAAAACFCGCGAEGHRHAGDCFVSRRAEDGQVLEWNRHGLECGHCIDVANYTRELDEAGLPAARITGAVDERWAGRGRRTPTGGPDRRETKGAVR